MAHTREETRNRHVTDIYESRYCAVTHGYVSHVFWIHGAHLIGAKEPSWHTYMYESRHIYA